MTSSGVTHAGHLGDGACVRSCWSTGANDAARATTRRANGQPPSSMCAWNSSRNLVDVAHDRHRVGVAERAEALAVDPLADVEQQVEVGLRRRAVLDLAAGSAPSSACPRGTACTCRTTRARRTARRAGRAAPCSSDRRSRSPRRSRHRPGLGQRVEVERRVDLVGRQDRRRGAARDDRLQLAAVRRCRRRSRRSGRAAWCRAGARSCRRCTTLPESEKTRVPVESRRRASRTRRRRAR